MYKKKIKFDDLTSVQIKLIPGDYILDKDQINPFRRKAWNRALLNIINGTTSFCID